MIVRNGQALGSVHHRTAPGAEPAKRKPGRPKKPVAVVDARTDTERIADEDALAARRKLGLTKSSYAPDERDDEKEVADGDIRSDA